MSTTRRELAFVTPYQKARWMQGMAVLDSFTPAIREEALRFAKISDPLQRATAIHDHVRDRIRYMRDPGGIEQLDSASVALARGFGDCDAKARAVVALATAAEKLAPVGISAAVQPIFPNPDWFSHVAAALRWPGSNAHPLADASGWVRSETILAGVPLGHGSEAALRARGRVVYS